MLSQTQRPERSNTESPAPLPLRNPSGLRVPVMPARAAATPGCPRRAPRTLARSLSGVPDEDADAPQGSCRCGLCAPVDRAESTGLVLSWNENRANSIKSGEDKSGKNKNKSKGGWDAALEREYAIEGALGYGATAEVLLGRARRTGELVAIKKIPQEFVVRQEFQRIGKEIRILRELQHPNLIAYRDALITPRFLYIVLEYAEGRTLFDEIQDRRRLSEHDAAAIVREVARGLQYLHSHRIVHADLKPENIIIGHASSSLSVQPPLLSPTPVLPARITVTDADDADTIPRIACATTETTGDAEDDDSLSVKIIDFGLARMVPSLHQECADPLCLSSLSENNSSSSSSNNNSGESESKAKGTEAGGTLPYRAPELLEAGGASTPEADMWALGVILFTMLGGYPPFMSDADALAEVATSDAPFWYFSNRDTPLLRDRIYTADFEFVDACWAGVSERARDVVRALLCRCPADRPTAAQLLATPWVRAAPRLPRTRAPRPPSSASASPALSGTPDDAALARSRSIGHTLQILDRVLRDSSKRAALPPPRTLSRPPPSPLLRSSSGSSCSSTTGTPSIASSCPCSDTEDDDVVDDGLEL